MGLVRNNRVDLDVLLTYIFPLKGIVKAQEGFQATIRWTGEDRDYTHPLKCSDFVCAIFTDLDHAAHGALSA